MYRKAFSVFIKMLSLNRGPPADSTNLMTNHFRDGDLQLHFFSYLGIVSFRKCNSKLICTDVLLMCNAAIPMTRAKNASKYKTIKPVSEYVNVRLPRICASQNMQKLQLAIQWNTE